MKKSFEILIRALTLLVFVYIRQAHAGDVSFENQINQNNTNPPYQDGLAVLHRAAQEANIQDINWGRRRQSCVEDDPNVNSIGVNSHINTLLQRAIRQSNIRSMQSLIRQGIDSNLLNPHALTLIRMLLAHYEPQYLELIKNLIALQQNIHTLDEQGQSLLHLAARYGDVAVVNYLYTQGMDIDVRNREGQTFLHQAIQNPDIRVLCHTITEHPQVINLADMRGETPAHLAARIGTVTILRHCQGMDFTVRNPRGQIPLVVAIQAGRPQEIIEVIKTLMPQSQPRASPQPSATLIPQRVRLVCQYYINTNQTYTSDDDEDNCLYVELNQNPNLLNPAQNPYEDDDDDARHGNILATS